MGDIFDELPSLKKQKDLIFGMKKFSFFLNRKEKEEFCEAVKAFDDLIFQINFFNEKFSEKGWILYDKIDVNLIKDVNSAFSEKGFEEAEQILTHYYSTKIENILPWLKSGSPELSVRYQLILNAFNDHKERRYFASVPQFLMIIDGAVNDHTRQKGFFAEGTDVDVWDCLVGCSDSLQKLKSVCHASRKKTNPEPIFLPYRHGILHGRELNYGNIYVSSKCIVLLFAVHDWIVNKKSEEVRKEKFLESEKPISWKSMFKNIQQNIQDKKITEAWTPRVINIGTDIPESGGNEEYREFEYIQTLVKMLESWKAKNYGALANSFIKIPLYVEKEKLRPKIIKEFFGEKLFLSFKLLEIEEKACSLRRILVEVQWESQGALIIKELEFGLIYQDEKDTPLAPGNCNGKWVIWPHKVYGLFEN